MAVPALRKLLHPYYVTNIALAVSFLVCKLTRPVCVWAFDECELDYRESEILFFTAVIILFRTRKQGAVSLIPYVSTACMFSKLACLILFSYSDPIYGIIFAAISLLHLLVLPEPVYQGPEHVTYFRPDEFEQELGRDRRIVWLIEMYAAWNPVSVDFASCFAELSARYSLDNLRFGKVDVTKSQELAQKYKINTSFLSKQLPTLILFKDGRELVRRPLVSDKNRLIAFVFNQDNVVSTFDLNNVFEECKSNPLKKQKQAVPELTKKED